MKQKRKKMTPDAYMPFYGDKILSATKGYGEAIFARYLKALWHNWTQCHCTGLPNDDEYLRNVCECPITEWARTRGIVFGLFFKLGDDQQWHQKFQDEVYEDATSAYEARLRNCGLARANNPKNNPALRPEQGIDQGTDQALDQGIGSRDGQDPKPKLKPSIPPFEGMQDWQLERDQDRLEQRIKDGKADDSDRQLLEAIKAEKNRRRPPRPKVKAPEPKPEPIATPEQRAEQAKRWGEVKETVKTIATRAAT